MNDKVTAPILGAMAGAVIVPTASWLENKNNNLPAEIAVGLAGGALFGYLVNRAYREYQNESRRQYPLMAAGAGSVLTPLVYSATTGNRGMKLIGMAALGGLVLGLTTYAIDQRNR
jgi:predicted benzoate:H+ symporter BenE